MVSKEDRQQRRQKMLLEDQMTEFLEEISFPREIEQVRIDCQKGYTEIELYSFTTVDAISSDGTDDDDFICSITTAHPKLAEIEEDMRGFDELPEFRKPNLTQYQNPLLQEESFPQLDSAVWWPVNFKTVVSDKPLTALEALKALSNSLQKAAK